jgi:beta-galactosidase/beta-glucuronidase
VALPHTFNAVDGEAGGAFYRGPAWYRRTLDLAPGDARRFIEFDGAAMAADVWLNGRHAGRHEGGYARFRLDVTALAKPGRNTLAVRVDNRTLPTVAPLGGDFTVFGGLYRGVRLIETAPVHIELLDHGGPGVSVETGEITATAATLRVNARLRNELRVPRHVVLRLTLRDADGRTVLRTHQALDLAAQSNQLANASLNVARPHLWQGMDDPYLYRLAVELLQGDAVVDALELPVGIRTVAVDPQRGFLLNGKPLALHGVNYFHSGRPGHGVAVRDAEIDEDFRILQDLGANALRLVHYQHPQRVYERADELGFVLWTEVPLNAAMDEGEAFRTNLSQQLSELIRQNRQHPSVAIWGLGNEVYRGDEPVRALLATLHAQARQEDPQRLTAYAHCCAADDHPLALQTDITGYNRYWGWYDREVTDLGPWLDALHARLPGRALSISEYGAGASALQQEDPPQRPQPGSRWHPEQYQAMFHEAYWSQIGKRPWLAGSFVWLAFDHASAGRNEGDRPGINDKGLVSYDRRALKDAYHLYRAHWSRTPMVHIASARFTPRPAGPTSVKAYTNGKRATLELNGVVIGTATAADRIATWPDVPLAPGRNVLSVRTDAGAADSVVWEGRP